MGKIEQKMQLFTKEFKKFRYPLLVLLLGVAIMCMPLGAMDGKDSNEGERKSFTYTEDDLETRLEELLTCVEGVGKVKVLLSVDTGTVRSFQADTQVRSSDETQEMQSQTVILSASGEDFPLETAVEYPTYRGAIVVCDGADKASVKLKVIQAVSGTTGLGADRITVIKMRSN